MDYVLGYVFDKSLSNLALIKKNKPDWMKDKWNGVGGKIELNESVVAAMQREFFEETGVDIPSSNWLDVAKLQGGDYNIWIFTAVTNKVFDARSVTNEDVGVFHLDRDFTLVPVLDNVKWQIEMCLCNLKNSETYEIKVR